MIILVSVTGVVTAATTLWDGVHEVYVLGLVDQSFEPEGFGVRAYA